MLSFIAPESPLLNNSRITVQIFTIRAKELGKSLVIDELHVILFLSIKDVGIYIVEIFKCLYSLFESCLCLIMVDFN